MRIIGGVHRGRPLAQVGRGDPAAHLRPTSDKVREAVFNILASMGLPEGAAVLDLFAGTGSLGLEALSRGAASATFVDKGRAAQGLIRRNVAALGVQDTATLIGRDAMRLGLATSAFDLVFLDPPYGKGLVPKVLLAVADGGWLSPGCVVVCEDSAPAEIPAGLAEIQRRRYGDTWITIAEATSSPGGVESP